MQRNDFMDVLIPMLVDTTQPVKVTMVAVHPATGKHSAGVDVNGVRTLLTTHNTAKGADDQAAAFDRWFRDWRDEPEGLPLHRDKSVCIGKPHLWRYLPDSPIVWSDDERHARFILLNSDGEFRSFWLYHAAPRLPAIEARLRGVTHYQGEPCPDCGGTDYYAHPLTWNTEALFGAARFAKGECYACMKDPSLRSPERRERAASFRQLAGFMHEMDKALELASLSIVIRCLKMAQHYGRGSDKVRSTRETRVEWLRLAAECETA